jgi:hypothetical protein
MGDQICHSASITALERAFPDRGDPPTIFQKCSDIPFVSLDVGRELRRPEFRTGRWRCREGTFAVAVPEASMHENDSLVLGEDKVSFAGQFCSVEPVTEAPCMQRAPQEQFRLGILASNACHHP